MDGTCAAAARQVTWHSLPAITRCGTLSFLGRLGVRGASLESYAATRRELVARHGILLRIAAVENAASPRAARAAWDRAVARALAAGRGR